MAAIIQLSPGGTATVGQGAIAVTLSSVIPAQVVLLRADGAVVEPDFRKSASELVLLPREPVVVAARSVHNQPFPPGSRIGVAFRSASGFGDEVVRPAVEVGGQQSVTLARITADGVIHDALAEGRSSFDGEGLFGHAWMKPGAYAYHVNQLRGPAGDLTWALVVDGSASMLVDHRRADLGSLLETVIGIVATAYGSAPRALQIATEPVRDVVAGIDQDLVDWQSVIGKEPAPWARVTQAVQATAGVQAVVLVLDGVPVDYRQLTQWARHSEVEVLVVAVGISRYGITAESRPTQPWQEQLAALDELAALDNVRLVALPDLSAASTSAAALADALFPARSHA